MQHTQHRGFNALHGGSCFFVTESVAVSNCCHAHCNIQFPNLLTPRLEDLEVWFCTWMDHLSRMALVSCLGQAPCFSKITYMVTALNILKACIVQWFIALFFDFLWWITWVQSQPLISFFISEIIQYLVRNLTDCYENLWDMSSPHLNIRGRQSGQFSDDLANGSETVQSCWFLVWTVGTHWIVAEPEPSWSTTGGASPPVQVSILPPLCHSSAYQLDLILIFKICEK